MRWPDREKAASAMATHGFALCRRLLGADEVRALSSGLSEMRERRVVKGRADVAWTERTPEIDSPQSRFFTEHEVLSFVAAATGIPFFFPDPEVWLSCYALGEHIDPHVDKFGDAQFLVCLSAPPEDAGGTLRFGHEGELGEVTLEAGDAVLFFASRTLHSTVPLRATREVDKPSRVVLVGRYYRMPLDVLRSDS